MAECECLQACPFFNDKMPATEGMGAIYKKKYCLGDKLQCARYMVFSRLGRASVPADLYPNMVKRAQSILAARQ